MKNLISILAVVTSSWLLATPAMADTLSDIKARGELVVGMEIAYKPFEFFQDGKVVGYDVDVANAIAKAMGVKLRTVDTAWAGILPALLEKKFDMVLSGLTITPDRMKKVDFTQPVAIGSVVLLVRADDDKITKADDVAGRAVATQLGSVGDGVCKSFEAKLKAAGKPGFASFKLFDSFIETYLELATKRIDVVCGALPVMQTVVTDRPGKFKIISGVQTTESYLAAAVRKGDDSLLKFLDDQITSLKSGGELEKLQVKWFGALQVVPNAIPANLR